MNAPGQTRRITVLDFKLVASAGPLIGFADLHLPAWRLRLFGVAVFDNGSRRWVALPAKPQLDRDKRALTGADGKVTYNPTAAFDDKATADRFSEAVVSALLAFKPDAFGRTGNGQ
ncbi:hypothetical protein [Mesorhizobium sp.]|uniref:hypothetical protein n=1 Tax=Mesorhizobium sp. TaxID=1871066 RepID=UPI002579D0A0|nr:hypothetical protein [Mesorhizobium sp.]